MAAFDKLAGDYLAPDITPPALKRIGSAVLGSGIIGSLPYRNILLVGSDPSGLVIVLGRRQVLIPWSRVESAKAPWGIFPREKWLVGEEKIPLVVPKGTVQVPLADPGE
jgi:hypothetical protein